MAKTARRKTLTFPDSPRRKSLIEWNDPKNQAHVLDWRQRAHGFGLDVEEREDEGPPFAPPERLLLSEEPEAFADQSIHDEDELDREELDEQEEATAAASCLLILETVRHSYRERHVRRIAGQASADRDIQ